MPPRSGASEARKLRHNKPLQHVLHPHPGAVTFHTAFEHKYDVSSQPGPTNTWNIPRNQNA